MVGISTAVVPDSITLREMGTDVLPSSAGEVQGSQLESALAENYTPRMFRAQDRYTATTGIMGMNESGIPIQGEPEPLIDPFNANKDYGIPGHLSFTDPVPQSVAKDLYEHKRAQLDREDTIARRESGLLTGGAARFATSMVGSLLDPVNLAAGLIPIIGPAREAALVAQAASAAGRVGIRAGLGAAQGAVAMAALQPLEFGLSQQEHEDYTMAMALRSVALGTVLGGGLHAGVGALTERAAGRYRNPLTQRLEEAGPEARETLLQGALAQHLEDRPVEVAPAIDAMENAAAARLRRIDELTNDRLAAERGDIAAGSPVRSFSAMAGDEARASGDIAEQLRQQRLETADLARPARRPEDIVEFLKSRGGVFDEGGDLRAMDLNRTQRGAFGILSTRNGLSLDYAREAAEEAGFLRPGSTTTDLLGAIQETARGNPVFRPEDAVDYKLDAGRRRGGDFADAGAFDPNQMFAEAVNDLTTAARRVPEVSDATLASREAVKAPNDELQAIENHNAELEARRSPAGAENATEPATVDPEMELAEARARAYERAGACLTRGG